MQKKFQFSIQGMHCGSCVAGIEASLNKVPGIKEAKVNFASKSAYVVAEDNVTMAGISKTIADLGYEAIVEVNEEVMHQHEAARYGTLLKRAGLAFIVGVPLFLDMFFQYLPSLHTPTWQWPWLLILVITFAVLTYSGRDIYAGAFRALLKGQANMDTLVALGTGAAWFYSAVVVLIPMFIPAMARHVYFDTAVILLAFINFGQALEAKARGKTSNAIKALLNLTPETARVIRAGEELEIPLNAVVLGDQLRARPGDKIAVDGEVIEGSSQVDESMLTGESMPVQKNNGDHVSAGTINQSGSFIYTAGAIGNDTALARIIGSVKQAQNSKPKIGRLADKVAGVFVPIVISIAILTAILWGVFGPDPKTAFIMVTTVAVLVIACPCALGLATPISIMIGVGKAASSGVLIRNGDALQMASKLTTIVLDKTGTITQGKPSVVAIKTLENTDENHLLQLAASIEQGSEHALAAAIVAYAKTKNINLMPADSFHAEAGFGVRANINNETVYIGKAAWLQKNNIDVTALIMASDAMAANAQTPVFIGTNNKALGVIAIADPLKIDSVAAIQKMRQRGLTVVMLTGDNRATAMAVAKKIGVDQVIAEVLPDEKGKKILELQSKGESVAMVGDGVNDAPALAAANVGFAIGSGTDVAIEAADVTLIGGSLLGVDRAIFISHATIKNIKQNLWGAFLYNSLGIPVAAGILYPFIGILLSPLIAGLAMALSSVTVVTNANRLRLM